MVDQDRWRKLEDLFYAALDLPAGGRSSFLDEACEGDPALREEADSLLASAEKTMGFLHKPVQDGAQQFAGDIYAAGSRIGAYEILGTLGEGGMGRVYLAARADEHYQQRVAIKVMHGALRLSAGMLLRFRGERQILANLDHPNIARLLDGGVTPEGVPYLVMEYVDGAPVDEYCRNLTIGQRLELFRKICAAVDYAHKNLVIHRDIKCANILVNSEGEPKLLDFGIAKLLDPARASGTVTVASERFLTPDYASPEQLRGEPVTTATDVYMLGVLLYELLSGKRPFLLDLGSPLEAARIVCETDPPPPSAATASLNFKNILRGDLDCIVLMAMRKEPSRRYSSVGQLSADVLAHLRGFPVAARTDAWSYRTGKFVRRHKAAVTATAVVLFALIGFGIGMGLLARRASREQLIARRESEFLASIFQAPTPEVSRGRTITALELLDQGAQRINSELAGNDEARASLLETIASAYRSLGKYDRALPLGRDAYRLETRLYGPDDVRTAGALDLSASVERLTGDYKQAEASFRKVAGLVRRREGRDDDSVANVLAELGECLFLENSDADAEPVLRQALAIHRREAQKHAGQDQGGPDRDYLALLLERKGEYPEAATLLREAADLEKRISGPDSPRYVIALHNQASNLIDLGDLAGAEKGLREDLALRRKILGKDNPDVMFSLNNLSFVLIEKGDAASAGPLLREGLAMAARPEAKGFQVVPAIENNWARYLQARGAWKDASQAYQKALGDAVQIAGAESWQAARITSNIGLLQFDRGDYARAEGFARQALAMVQKLGGNKTPALASALIDLAEDRLFQGDPSSAVPLLRDAVDIRRKRYNPGNPAIVTAMVSLGEALTAQGNAAEAEPLLRSALQSARQAPFPLLPWQTAEAESALGACLTALHQEAEGGRLVAGSQSALRSHPRPAFRRQDFLVRWKSN